MMSLNERKTQLEGTEQNRNPRSTPHLPKFAHFFYTLHITGHYQTPDNSSRMMKKHVSFSKIDIIVLPMILGDNPSCKNGPPVQPCWNADFRYSVNVDLFEQERSNARRPPHRLYLSSIVRRRLLGIPPPTPKIVESKEEGLDANKLMGRIHAVELPMIDNLRPLNSYSDVKQEISHQRSVRRNTRQEQNKYPDDFLQKIHQRMDRAQLRLSDLEKRRDQRSRQRRRSCYDAQRQ